MSNILIHRRHLGGTITTLRDFCIVAQSASVAVTFNQRGTGTLLYSIDRGNTWSNVISGQALPTLAQDEKMYFRGFISPNTTASLYTSRGVGTFQVTGNYYVQGGILSLVNGDNWTDTDEVPYRAFCSLFYGSTTLLNAYNLVVPSGETKQEALDHAFYGCINLLAAPPLPSSVVNYYSYYGMFANCSNLHRIEVGFTSWLGNITDYWMQGASNIGTFYCPATLSVEYGVSRIPSGWSVETI